MRHRTGDHFGLIRMGVRLYDPNLGRFHGVDPVDGGSASTYDYCNADPINCRDLDGEFAFLRNPIVRAVAKVAAGAAVGALAVAAGTALCAASAGVACAFVVAGVINATAGTAVVTAVDCAGGVRVTRRAVATQAVLSFASGGAGGALAARHNTSLRAVVARVIRRHPHTVGLAAGAAGSLSIHHPRLPIGSSWSRRVR
jgi:RHS repeat-associated protein